MTADAEDTPAASPASGTPASRTGSTVFARVESVIGAFWLPALLFAGTLAGFLLSRPDPIEWYDHHLYLAKAMLSGSLDVAAAGIPDWYQDTVTVGDAKYLPYGPTPAILLMPFVAIWGLDFSQIEFSMVLGAVNLVLFWYMLRELKVSRVTQILLVPFFAFGTVHFYAATTGTLWFYNHVVATFFLFLGIIFFLRGASPFVPGAAVGLAWQARGPTLLAAPFFVYFMIKRRHQDFALFSPGTWRLALERQTIKDVAIFGAALVPFAIFVLIYNQVRFDDPFDSGFNTVYETYTAGGLPYSFYRLHFPNAEHFALFDIRNVPLHLYTIFMMPPEYHPDWSIFRPSPYGLSILLTSPAFIYAFFVRRYKVMRAACWLAIVLIAVPIFMHYSQGWVQFGYRFAIDFMPFLLILTALGFDDRASPTSRKIQIALVALAILAGFWGRYWGNELGW